MFIYFFVFLVFIILWILCFLSVGFVSYCVFLSGFVLLSQELLCFVTFFAFKWYCLYLWWFVVCESWFCNWHSVFVFIRASFCVDVGFSFMVKYLCNHYYVGGRFIGWSFIFWRQLRTVWFHSILFYIGLLGGISFFVRVFDFICTIYSIYSSHKSIVDEKSETLKKYNVEYSNN